MRLHFEALIHSCVQFSNFNKIMLFLLLIVDITGFYEFAVQF